MRWAAQAGVVGFGWKQILIVIQIIQSLKKLQSKTRFKENIHCMKPIKSVSPHLIN